MRRPILDHMPAYKGLLGEQPTAEDDTSTPVAFSICNISSVIFFICQFCYASYTLFLLSCRNEKSRSLIAATLMIMASSVCLSVLFILADEDFYDQSDWSISQKLFYVTCNELPFTMVFMAHWIIFYQYLELAVALPILIKIADHAHNASNKIASARQCLNATMIIVVAIVVAHFVDKAFYTFKESSADADQKVTYFAIALKLCLIVMIAYVFVRIRTVVHSEPLIKLNKTLWLLHVSLLSIYYLMWAAYEVTYTTWMLDPNSKHDISDNKLKVLAVVELLFNIVSVFLGCLLFYMVDRMTRPVEECYFDPILKRHVPFFVHLANTKLIK